MRRVTLTQYLVEHRRHHNKVSSELRLLIEVVARACKAIGHAVGVIPGSKSEVGLVTTYHAQN